MSLLNLQGQVMAGIKRKASVVLCMEAECSTSKVQNMKVLWKLLLTAEAMVISSFFCALCVFFFWLLCSLCMERFCAFRQARSSPHTWLAMGLCDM